MDDRLRCHAMHFEEGIGDLVTPLDRRGPWTSVTIDVETMDTTFKSPEGPHDVQRVACADCHPGGVPKKRTVR
jgi:hypothetical protein